MHHTLSHNVQETISLKKETKKYQKCIQQLTTL
jgi:hypothetical protein